MKLKSSIVFRNGKCARRVSRASRVCWRCAISSAAHEGEKVAIRPGLALGALDEIAPDAPRIGEMEALEAAHFEDERDQRRS